jgi:hypothetical protein
MGVAALVLGIIGVLLSLNPFFTWFALPIDVLALILGVVGLRFAKNEQRPTGTATAGLVLGIVGTVLSVLFWIMCTLLVSGAKKAVDEGVAKPFKKLMDEASKEAKQERERPVPLEPAQRAIKVSAEELVASFEDDEVAARKKYKGKTLLVSGTLASTGKDLFDGVYLTLEGGAGDFDQVWCDMVPAEYARTLALTPGKPVKVRGLAKGKDLHVSLKGCVLEGR